MGKFIDITGQTVRDLVVVGRNTEYRNSEIYWFARCTRQIVHNGIERECGSIHSYRGHRLRHEEVTCCPDCSARHMREYMSTLGQGSLIDLTGKQYTDYLVLGRDTNATTNYPRWLCRCLYRDKDGTVCNKVVSVNGAALRNGQAQRCKGCRGKRQRRYIAGDMPRTYWLGIRNGAKTRGHEVLATPEEAWQQYLKQAGKCALTGVTIGFRDDGVSKSGCYTRHTASLDRIDSSKPYIAGNIQWIYKPLNEMKNDSSSNEFIAHCILVAEHHKHQFAEAA